MERAREHDGGEIATEWGSAVGTDGRTVTGRRAQRGRESGVMRQQCDRSATRAAGERKREREREREDNRAQTHATRCAPTYAHT